ncbi:eCIS core domain-containing protein [Chitinophaga tropicalis]|uniref:DUF4157 domain-containing protein n=1 Tax=Chitinophaga tropicalis TaxID=2683588 RepID=A0A7K1U1T8_9BACT|nr:DUF4157 domain-containing protein [Chitinophaga tropicalis]MVT08331.1 DUF4157 domain-containing protein [Chitinophaga tropicalis]
MKSNSRRYRRHRNPEAQDKKETPFFSPRQKEIQTKEDAFFQPKLAVGQPGDSYEREADAVASRVVDQHPAKGSPVQRKEISTVQAMPEKKEEEKVQKKGAGDKKEEEKPLQKRDEPGKKEEEKPLQKKDDPGKKEEEKPLQKKDDPGKKEEEKPLQKKEEPEKKLPADEKLKKEEEGKPGVMTKESPSLGRQQANEDLAGRLKEQRSKGNPLPADVYNEMSSAIGADFSNVRIHTDDKAAQLNSELGAQAFTHGNDVYFNSGKYDTESTAGKRLLAHELTHVVQQGAAPAVVPGVQRKKGSSAPKKEKPPETSRVAELRSGGFTFIDKPDRKAGKKDKIPGNRAKTMFKMPGEPVPVKNKDGLIESVTIPRVIEMETIYGSRVTAGSTSGYGRGFIRSDKDAHNDSLGFHEGHHKQDFRDFVDAEKFPEIVIDSPITETEYEKRKKEWYAARKKFAKRMQKYSIKTTDEAKD